MLVVAGLGVWVDGTPRTEKIETHVYPVADAAREVTLVCTGPTPGPRDGLTYHRVTPSRWKLLTLLKQFLATVRLALVEEYDLVVSFSLLPYGLFALGAKYLTGTPAHLGIIGGDLDVHARARYGPLVVRLFRRFDVITIAGENYRDRLVDLGVRPERIFAVLHPVEVEFSGEGVADDPTYDLLWLTRMSPEKDPLLFVDVLSELRDRGVDFTAALVGGGPVESTVREAVERRNLGSRVETPGWTDDPFSYYREAYCYVLTSEREMLPLTLVESMSVGVPPVVPPLGAIPDLVSDGTNGLLVSEREAAAYADAIERLLGDEKFRDRLAANATAVETDLSYEAVASSWEDIFDHVRSTGGRPARRATSAGESGQGEP